MRASLRKLFSPILTIFESGTEPYAYKPLNRKILVVMGCLFTLLASAVAFLSYDGGDLGFLIPVVVFGGVGLVCLVVGLLGNERAVASIWGNK